MTNAKIEKMVEQRNAQMKAEITHAALTLQPQCAAPKNVAAVRPHKLNMTL